MPFKCYYCLKKYHNGNDYIEHCRSDHLDSELSLYKPHTFGYIATHWSFAHKDSVIYNASLYNPVLVL